MSIKDLENSGGKEVRVSIQKSSNMLFKHVRSLLSQLSTYQFFHL